MKTIGIIGGMSWESTSEYYRQINELTKSHLGGLHSAQIIIYSVDFDAVESLQSKGDWEELTRMMIDAAYRLKSAGAELLVIATNTMHKMADLVQRQVGLPLVHIADATAEAINQLGLKKVALLGTRYTMEQDFYKQRIKERYNIEVLVPEPDDMDKVHEVIFEELVLGDFYDESRYDILDIVDKLADQGAEGVILGCTELPLLIQQEHLQLPIFDTTKLHVNCAIRRALEQ